MKAADQESKKTPTWKQVAENPKFKEADWETRQAVRAKFFDEHVKPRAPEGSLEKLRGDFFSATEKDVFGDRDRQEDRQESSQKDSDKGGGESGSGLSLPDRSYPGGSEDARNLRDEDDEGVMRDLGLDLSAGSLEGGAYTAGGQAEVIDQGAEKVDRGLRHLGLGELIDEGDAKMDGKSPAQGLRGVQSWMKDRSQELLDSQSEEHREAKEGSIPSGSWDPRTWSLGEDPSLRGYAGNIAYTLGQFAPQLAGMAAKSERAREALTAVLGGLQAGGAEAKQAFDMIGQMDEDELADISGRYSRLVDEEGVDPEDAQREVAEEARGAAFRGAAPTGAVGGYATSRILGPFQKKLQGGLLSRMGKSGLAEGAVEGAQEVAEGVAGTASVNQAIDSDLDLADNPFGEGLLGAATGGLVGAAGGLTGGRQDRDTDMERDPEWAQAWREQGVENPYENLPDTEVQVRGEPADREAATTRDPEALGMERGEAQPQGQRREFLDSVATQAEALEDGATMPDFEGDGQLTVRKEEREDGTRTLRVERDDGEPAFEFEQRDGDWRPTGVSAEPAVTGEAIEGAREVSRQRERDDSDQEDLDLDSEVDVPERPGELIRQPRQDLDTEQRKQRDELVDGEAFRNLRQRAADLGLDDAVERLDDASRQAQDAFQDETLARANEDQESLAKVRERLGEPAEIYNEVAEQVTRGGRQQTRGRDQEQTQSFGLEEPAQNRPRSRQQKPRVRVGVDGQPLGLREPGERQTRTSPRSDGDLETSTPAPSRMTKRMRRQLRDLGYKEPEVGSMDPQQAWDILESGTPSTRSRVEQAAQQIDTSPSDAQIRAGNYRKGRARVQGLDVAIENPKGSTRRGTDPDGTPWESRIAHDYGDIKGTRAPDGDNVDVFVGDQPDTGRTFVIDQLDQDGNFDEPKVMVGFPDEESARRGYLDNYPEGWEGLGQITETTPDEVRNWARDGDTSKPFGELPKARGRRPQRRARKSPRRDKVADTLQSPVRKALNDAEPGDTVTFSRDTGYARGNTPYRVLEYADNGDVRIENADTGGRTTLKRSEVEAVDVTTERQARPPRRTRKAEEVASRSRKRDPQAPAPRIDSANARTGQPIRATGYRVNDIDPNDLYAGAQTPVMGPGTYASPTPEDARAFSPDQEAQVSEQPVELENPLVVRGDNEWRDLTRAAGWDFPNPSGQSRQEVERQTEALQREVRRRGHDGIAVVWNDDTITDMDEDTGKPIKTLRDVFSKPQVVAFPAAEQGARYRQRPNDAMSWADVERTLRPLRKQGMMVEAVSDVDGLPQPVRDKIRADGVEDLVSGVFYNNTAWIVAGKMSSPHDVTATALHEAVGHHGVSLLLGDTKAEVMEAIYRDMPASRRDYLESVYAGQIRRMTPDRARQVIAEEHVAHLAETDPSATVLDRVVSRMRSWIRRVFGARAAKEWGRKEIVDLIADARGALGRRASRSNEVHYRINEPEKGLRRRVKNAPTVSVRFPKAVKKTFDPITHYGQLDIKTLSKAQLTERQAALVEQYPNFRPTKGANTPEKKLARLRSQVESNLLWLYDQVPEDVLGKVKRWYEGANRVARTWSKRYNLADRQTAGVIAALSPQKDWFQNASLAERMLDIWTENQNTPWSPEMSETLKRIYGQKKYADLREAIEGNTLSSIDDTEYQGAWIRVFDETYNDRAYRNINPDGSLGDFALTQKGKMADAAWGSNNEIRKAVSILRDGSDANLNAQLGGQHKVRNFYNNIMAPDSKGGFVTIDTHAVAAGLLRPLAGQSREVLHNFGQNVKGEPGPGSNSAYGIAGTYAVYAEAYRNAAAKRGVLPREMQSITWEMVRALFSPGYKRQAANTAKISDDWTAFKNGRATLEQTRQAIWDHAGGIDFGRWRRPDSAAHDPQQVATYQRDVSGDQVAGVGGPRGPSGRRARGEHSRAVPGGRASDARFRLTTEQRQRRFAASRPGRSGSPASRGFTRRSPGDAGRQRVLAQYRPTREFRRLLEYSELGEVVLEELDTSRESAQRFTDAINESKRASKHGAAVYVYPTNEYQSMRLFMTPDGKSGLAIKDDGDIVSVFSDGGRKAHAMLTLAVEQGGTKLDAFDTVLPDIYAVNGFKEVGRDPWNEDYRPEGWDKEVFKRFNNGEPDVVYMEYDPDYSPFEGEDPRYSLTGGTDGPGRPESARDRGGRDQGRGLAPLEGAPTGTRRQGKGPDPELNRVAERYAEQQGIDLRRQAEYVKVDVERAERIAQAYEEMEHSPRDPAVQEAYQDMIRQTRAQYDALVEAGYEFSFFDSETDPYGGNPWEAMRDLRNNKKMAVYGTYDGYGTEGITGAAIEENPLLEDTGIEWPDQNGVMRPVTANDLFRAVHDAFGHGLEGAGFRARGEENAWQAHIRLFHGPAVGAMTTETRGQNSWLNFGPYGEHNRTAGIEDTIFAEQKVGLMPEWTWTEGRADTETRYSLNEDQDYFVPETEGARVQFGYAGQRDAFSIQAGDAEVTGYYQNADFPGDREQKSRGEIFLVTVPPSQRRRGTGTSLAKDAIALMASQGAETVNISTTSPEGRRLVGNLVAEGVVSEPIRTSDSGKAEHTILQDSDPRYSLAPPTDSAEFKRWFGDSKVVDENGDPLVVYHGTGERVNEFDTGRVGQRDPGFYGKGFYFTPDLEDAQNYAETVAEEDGVDGEIIETYLSIQNPFIWDMSPEGEQDTRQRLAEMGVHRDSVKGDSNALGNRDDRRTFNQGVRDAGHDGVIVRDGDGILEVVAFSPTQIKGVDNTGSFDPDNPDIRYQLEDPVGGGYTDNDSTRFSLADETLTDTFLRKIQDKMLPLKRLEQHIQESGGRVNEDNDAYLAEELFHGKTEADLRHLEEQYVQRLADGLAMEGISQSALDKYLYARHAPERNRVIAERNPGDPRYQDGGSGMTDAEAAQIIQEVENSGKREAFDRLANIVYDMLRLRRDAIREGGMETDETLDAWESTYRNYVPLKGWAADEDVPPGEEAVGRPRTGRGFESTGSESRTALGRRTRSASPSTQAIVDTTQSLIRRRKNEVGQSLLSLVLDNPNSDLWQVFTKENPDLQRQKVTRTDPDTGRKRIVVEMRPVAMDMNDRYFKVKKNGREFYIKIRNQRLLNAMRNVGPESNSLVVRGMGGAIRVMASLVTSYNPEFMVTNFLRDVQTAVLNLSAEQTREDGRIKGESILRQTTRDIRPAMRAAYRGLAGKPARTGRGRVWDRYFQEYMEDGAKTGYFDMKDLDGQAKQIRAMMRRARGGSMAAMLKGRKAVTDFVENVNGSVENAVRLSAYVNARKAGISRKKAASLAKNMTVNFNRRGEVGTLINSLFMFFNASVQGTANFARAMVDIKPPQRGKSRINLWSRLNLAQKIGAGMAAGAFSLGFFNRMISGEDDDEQLYWDKIPAHEKERHIILMTGERDYVKIPMPYGYNIFGAAGTFAENATFGDMDLGDFGGEMMLAIMGSFNPIGFETSEEVENLLVKNISPTLMRSAVQVAINEDFAGRPIWKEDYDFGTPKPDSSRAFDTTPKAYRSFAEFLNKHTGGSEFRSGGIDVAPGTLQHLASFYGGGAYSFSEKTTDAAVRMLQGDDLEKWRIPFVGKVMGSVSEHGDMQTFYERREEVGQYTKEFEALPPEKAEAFYRNHRERIDLFDLATDVEHELSEMRAEIDAIEADDTITEERRDELVEEIEKVMEEEVDYFNREYRRSVRDE